MTRSTNTMTVIETAVVTASVMISWLVSLVVNTSVNAAVIPDEEPEPARPMLLTETHGLVAGATNFIAVSFDIDEGWHTYWPGQNDTGFATTIDLTLPDGWSAGDPLWPAPHRYVSPGEILDHVYENGQATILLPISIPADANTGPAKISADLEWLVCREACIPGWKTVQLDVWVLPQTARPRRTEHAKVFAAARNRFARPLPEHPNADTDAPKPGIELSWENGFLTIRAIQGSKVLTFAAHESGSPVKDLLKTGETKTGQLVLEREDPSKPIRGIVEVIVNNGKTPPLLYRIDSRPSSEQSILSEP